MIVNILLNDESCWGIFVFLRDRFIICLILVVILRKLICFVRKVLIVILLVVLSIVGRILFWWIVFCVSCMVGKCLRLGVLKFSFEMVYKLSGVIGVCMCCG